MAIYRLYTGDDGKSHMDELDLASQPDLTTLHASKGIVFRSNEPGRFSDWHNAPRRQYIITLSGEGEIGLEDGVQHAGLGDLFRLEAVGIFEHFSVPIAEDVRREPPIDSQHSGL